MEDAQTYRKTSKNYFFCTYFFLKVEGKLLIYPFLAFLAPSEHSSIEKTTPPEKNHSPLHLTPRSIIWDHNKMSESYIQKTWEWEFQTELLEQLEKHILKHFLSLALWRRQGSESETIYPKREYFS